MSNFHNDLLDHDSISISCESNTFNLPRYRLDEMSIEDFRGEILSSFNDSLHFRSTADTEHKINFYNDEFDSNVYKPDCQKEDDVVPTKNPDDSRELNIEAGFFYPGHKICGDTENESDLNFIEKKDIFNVVIEIEIEDILTPKTTKNKNRKNARDGIAKKLLTHVWQYIKDEFNRHLTKNEDKLGFHENNFPKKIQNLANKDLKSQVKIDAVKKFLDEKILDIYSKQWGDHRNNKEYSNYLNNLGIISRLKNKWDGISKEFKTFLSSTFDEQFQDYLDKQYPRDKIKIRKKQIEEYTKKSNHNEIEDYMKWFEIYVKGNSELDELGFREYYRNTPGNKKQKLQL